MGLLDYWLTVLQCVFANVTDGSAPRLSLYAFQFAGQLVSVMTVLMIESMREGNRRTMVSLYVVSIKPIKPIFISYSLEGSDFSFAALGLVLRNLTLSTWLIAS